MELDPLHSLSTDYLSLLSTSGDAIMSDVTFCIQGRQVQAHRCILSARSPFFRLMFSQDMTPGTLTFAPAPAAAGDVRPPPLPALTDQCASRLILPVDVVGYHAFVIVLRFLYSGQLLFEVPHNGCPQRACSHSSCTATIDLLLELILAAKFFGIDQLGDLVQSKLCNAVNDGVSVESLMRVLMVAKKQKLHRLWPLCADLVIGADISCDVLQRYLPREVITELAEARLQRSGYNAARSCSMNVSLSNNMPCCHSDQLHNHQNIMSIPSNCNNIMGNINIGGCCNEEQRIVRLQQALDCMDVELVRLMVMGEGLDLDKANALHYSIVNCNREVVKALLELGIVDVNYGDALGRTALHLAAELGNADMIAVLLDHHADPNALTHHGLPAVDIVRSLIKPISHDHFQSDHHPAAVMPPLCKADQKRIHLCIELLQSAAAVACREEAAESSCITQGGAAVQAHMTTTQRHRSSADAAAHGLPSNSCTGLTRDDRARPIITEHLNQEASGLMQSYSGMMRDDQVSAAVASTDRNQNNQTDPKWISRMSKIQSGISAVSGECSNLISPRDAADHQGGPENASYIKYLFGTTKYPEFMQNVQSTNMKECNIEQGKSPTTSSSS